MNKTLEILLKVVIFVVSVSLVTIGQRNIGFQGLTLMLIGLAGILGLLFLYNKAHQ